LSGDRWIQIMPNGTKLWFLDGLPGRTDGPAAEYFYGDKHWCLNGELHRTDGPAIEWVDGDKEWYLNGVKQTSSV
jgi:hypothetical protein